MTIALVFELPGGTQEQSDQVERMVQGTLAKGQLVHIAGPTTDGWCVIDVGASQEDADAFFRDTLAPALDKLGIPPLPPRLVFSIPVHRLVT